MKEIVHSFPHHWMDRMLSLACVLLAIIILYIANDYPSSAKILPNILAWMIMACGVGLWFLPGIRSSIKDVVMSRFIITLSIFLVSLWIFSEVGADLSLCILFMASARVMGYPINFKLSCITIVFCLVIGVIFVGLLGVPLTGPVFNVLSNLF